MKYLIVFVVVLGCFSLQSVAAGPDQSRIQNVASHSEQQELARKLARKLANLSGKEKVSQVLASRWSDGKSEDLILVLSVLDGPGQTVVESSVPFSNIASRPAKQKISLEAVSDLKERFRSAFLDTGLEELRSFQRLPLVKVRIKDESKLDELLASSLVTSVTYEQYFYPILNQSLSQIGQNSVVAAGADGFGQTVVVLDTGLDYTQSAFGNCSAPGVPATCRVIEAFDTATDDGSIDANGHGTYVSAIVAGVASGANLIGIDVFDGGTASSTDILSAIDWILVNQDIYNIGVVNLSLGGSTPYSSPCDSVFNPFVEAFAQLVANNIVPVVASGNDGYINALSNPACVSDAFSVGAVYDANLGGLTWSNCSDSSTSQDQVTCFSNSAQYLDILAPGALISAGGFNGGGTSMSAPHVAGAAAIIQAWFPNIRYADVTGRLRDSSVFVSDSRNGLSLPRLQISDSLKPVNDNFEDAVVLGAGDFPASGDNSFAGTEALEPNNLVASSWFRLQLDASGTYQFDLSGLDTSQVAFFYTLPLGFQGQATLSDLVLIEAVSHGESVRTEMLIGLDYYLQVGSSSGSGGSFDLDLVGPILNEMPVDEDIPIPAWASLVLFLALAKINFQYRRRSLK